MLPHASRRLLLTALWGVPGKSAESMIKISKVDAAKCQLQKEITLWFKDEDPVSIHTLVFVAYEVSHSVSKKRDPNRRDLLFDTLWIKDECRSNR